MRATLPGLSAPLLASLPESQSPKARHPQRRHEQHVSGLEGADQCLRDRRIEAVATGPFRHRAREVRKRRIPEHCRSARCSAAPKHNAAANGCSPTHEIADDHQLLRPANPALRHQDYLTAPGRSSLCPERPGRRSTRAVSIPSASCIAWISAVSGTVKDAPISMDPRRQTANPAHQDSPCETAVAPSAPCRAGCSTRK
jgi:hypothetical protein